MRQAARVALLVGLAAQARAQLPLRGPAVVDETPPALRPATAPGGGPARPSVPDLLYRTGDRPGADERVVGPDGRTVYPPPLEQAIDPSTYQVDRGDVLQARLWGVENFDIPLPVDAEGRLFIPRAGYVEAHGRTLAEVAREVTRVLGDRFPRLRSAVTLSVPRTFLVRVTGAVGAPGTSIPAGAWMRAGEVLERAGGVAPGGSSRFIELHRAGATTRVDLQRYRLSGDLAANPLVLDGDWLHVPALARAITVNGAVNRPGTCELEGGAETLQRALVEVGGVASFADLANAWIERPSAPGRERIALDLRALVLDHDATKDVPLRPGDIIQVPAVRTDVSVGGHVMKPGAYPYSLRLTAADYLALAGGETRDGARSRARVVGLDGRSRPLGEALRLEPGDSIVVPGKHLTTAEWVSITLGVISVGLSAAVLATNLRR